MKTSKSIADEVLRQKAREETEGLEAEKADEKIKVMVEKKLAEIRAEKEAEKLSEGDLEVHTTKPMSDLEIHAVEPVVPIEEKPADQPAVVKKVREKPADQPAVVKKVRVQERPIEAKPAEKSPGKPVVKKRWYDRIRPLGFEESE
jgi:hypothetical protein